MEQDTLGELVLNLEQDFISGGGTLMSKYVRTDLYEDMSTIYAYLNSKHTSGEYDSQGREKPFFNIVKASRNIWFRATDIDRKNIMLFPTKSQDDIGVFLLNVYLQDWMRKEKFGKFLNNWGLVQAGFNEAVVKFVEKGDKLICEVVPWSRLIVDQINFYANPKIEILELTESEMYDRGYDKKVIQDLKSAKQARETTNKQKQDNKNNYYKVYEVHGKFPLSYLTDKDSDNEEYVQQMHVLSFLKKAKGKGNDKYTLYKGKEEKDPYMLTALLPEEDNSIGLNGSVKNLFQSQWMINHTKKSILDQLDLASKLVFQTSDSQFLGQNAINAIETGDILVHALNQPLTQLANNSHDITALQNFGAEWKQLSNEINGISEAMLGAMPKAGTAWRQTEAILGESYNLFEIMTENRGLDIEDMLREHILPFLKKRMNNTNEISATLEMQGIDKIEKRYIKNQGIKNFNQKIKTSLLENNSIPDISLEDEMLSVEESLKEGGNQRFFNPSDVDDTTWKELFKNLETNIEINITGEATATQEALATLNTALKVIASPEYANNPTAQFVVGKILAKTGHLTQLEISQIPKPIAPQGGEVGAKVLPEITNATNEKKG